MNRLTHPGRFRAWVLVRLRGLPPDSEAGTWARRWRLAAQIYRDRAINTMVGLRMAQEDIRMLQDELDQKDDKRPLQGEELADYASRLRERAQMLWMASIDLTRERDAARKQAADQRESAIFQTDRLGEVDAERLRLLDELEIARTAFEALQRVSAGRRTDHLHMPAEGDPLCADCAAIAAYEARR